MTESKSLARRLCEQGADGFSGPSDPTPDTGSGGTEAHGVELPQVDPNADTWEGHCGNCGAPRAMEFEPKETVVFESRSAKLVNAQKAKK